MRVLGLIPARGGSKGIPRKNIRLLGGKPLLSYTAQCAMASKKLTRVILSTDDEEIGEVGRQCGLEVPFVRPAELASSSAPMLGVVQHALRWVESNGDGFDSVALLQPTNPFRLPDDIDACIDMLEDRDLDSVVTMLQVPAEYNPHWVYFQQEDGMLRLSTGEREPITRRQSLPPAFHREGSVYVTRRKVIVDGSLYGSRMGGHLIDPRRSVNIDEPEDWDRAEQMLLELVN